MCLARDYAVMACASMSGFAPLLRWLILITRCLALSLDPPIRGGEESSAGGVVDVGLSAGLSA